MFAGPTERTDQRPDRRGKVPADRFGPLPVRRHNLAGRRRAQSRFDQRRLRHRVRRRRRQAAAGLRLCRVCTVRLRLPALSRRAADRRGVRRLHLQGLARQMALGLQFRASRRRGTLANGNVLSQSVVVTRIIDYWGSSGRKIADPSVSRSRFRPRVVPRVASEISNIGLRRHVQPSALTSLSGPHSALII